VVQSDELTDDRANIEVAILPAIPTGEKPTLILSYEIDADGKPTSATFQAAGTLNAKTKANLSRLLSRLVHSSDPTPNTPSLAEQRLARAPKFVQAVRLASGIVPLATLTDDSLPSWEYDGLTVNAADKSAAQHEMTVLLSALATGTDGAARLAAFVTAGRKVTKVDSDIDVNVDMSLFSDTLKRLGVSRAVDEPHRKDKMRKDKFHAKQRAAKAAQKAATEKN